MSKTKKILIICAAAVLVIAIGYTAVFLSARSLVTAYSVEDYGRIFNSPEYKDHEVRTFGEGSYYSYLFSLPKTAPENTEIFEFVYEKDMYGRTSAYCVLSYKLSEEEFKSYCGTLANYALHYKYYNNKLLYTEDAFTYPAYVFEYMSEDGEDIPGGVAEYVLLNSEENEVICVYYSECDYEKIEEKVGLPISPKDPSVESVTGGRENIIAWYRGFSVYCFVNEKGEMTIPDTDEFSYAS